ncbi:hypothetical protein [Maritalea sp.]|uniref:hypothetical protein n=1 Tax=Maritalea sp. TaxID=2003361 RepID=UPI003EF342C5
MQIAEIDKTTSETVGPAQQSDLGWLHQHVHQAIDELDFYCDEFKAFEKARVNQNFLQALFDDDPDHLTILRKDGVRAGFMVSGPDNGVVFLYWSYILPEFRKSKLAILGNKYKIELFNNGHWHKMVTYTRTENRGALLLLKRYGWTEAAHLEKHIFGEDYKIFEVQYEKTIPGYKPFVVTGRLGRAIRQIKSWISQSK